MRTLDGTGQRAEGFHVVIADAERAVAVAGVMGGENSEITRTQKPYCLNQQASTAFPSV